MTMLVAAAPLAPLRDRAQCSMKRLVVTRAAFDRARALVIRVDMVTMDQARARTSRVAEEVANDAGVARQGPPGACAVDRGIHE